MVGDIDGDGRPDVVVANFAGASISVLINTTPAGAATPAFAVQHAFNVGPNPTSVAIADINGDGRPDVVAANFTDNTVSVLLNTSVPGAAPSFAPQQQFSVGVGAQFLTLTDVDGDGKPDIVVANENGNSVSLLLNTTAPGTLTASFALQTLYAAGNGPVCVIAADVNGDGKPDLIVANSGDNNLSVLLNAQYLPRVVGAAATGTIVHDYIFANGYD